MNADRGTDSGYQIMVDPAAFAETAASFLARRLHAASERGVVSIAVSGGRTPGPVYEWLARSRLPRWERTNVYLADERVVPFDDPSSNYGMLRETLLEPAAVPAERRHPMPVDEGRSAEAVAREYAAELPERLDFLLLGLGDDGHTASLFPNHSALEETERRVVEVRVPAIPAHRLTITPPVIAAARLIVVLVRGEAKASAVRAALMGEHEARRCPGVLARRGVWLLDRQAAEELIGIGVLS